MMQIKVDNVKGLDEFFAGRRILIIGEHEWKDHEADFVQMVNDDGTIPDPMAKKGKNLRMRVKTKFNTLDLPQENCFIIVSKTTQRPNQN